MSAGLAPAPGAVARRRDVPLLPETEAEACEIVREAMAHAVPLAIEGGGTKRTVGRPVQAELTLSARRLSGITLQEPAEMVVAAKAGTPLAEVAASLDAAGQHLTFEPPDWRALLGTTGEPTIGAVAAANLSGPRRIQAGAARDSLIGVRFVNGRGEVVKSGGRVMKNVTGLDLVKLLAGSWGTLGVLTEVTFKVLPRPEQSLTLVLRGLDDARAVAALAAALGSPYDVTGAAHLPGRSTGDARTFVRLEGFAFSVDYRVAELRRHLRRYGHADLVEGETAMSLWKSVRDVTPLAGDPAAAIWRISTAPSRGPAVTAAIAAALPARWFYDWGGGLVWLACPADGDAGAAAVRAALSAPGDHATLIRAPEPVRAAVPVFQPLAPALARLSAGIRGSLDPCRILNPGRMDPAV